MGPSRATGPRFRLDLRPRPATFLPTHGARMADLILHETLSEIPAADWDALAAPDRAGGRPLDPFTTHRFLSALERSGSVGRGTGWQPHPLVVRAAGTPVAVMPLYAKSHSQGE